MVQLSIRMFVFVFNPLLRKKEHIQINQQPKSSPNSLIFVALNVGFFFNEGLNQLKGNLAPRFFVDEKKRYYQTKINAVTFN